MPPILKRKGVFVNGNSLFPNGKKVFLYCSQVKSLSDLGRFFALAKLNGGGPKRPDNSPVDCCQRRPGGSPGQRCVDRNSAELSEAEGEQSLDCHPKLALPQSGAARGVQSNARTEKAPKDDELLT